MPPEPTSTLELDDETHQPNRRWEWVAEHCGMVLIATFVIAALLGLLGPGPLSRRITTSTDGLLSVDHHIIQRYQAPAKLLIGYQVPTSGTGVIRLHLSRSFTDRISVEQIAPEPQSMEMTENQLVYSFRTSDLTGDGKIQCRFKHDEYCSAPIRSKSSAQTSSFRNSFCLEEFCYGIRRSRLSGLLLCIDGVSHCRQTDSFGVNSS